MQWNGGDQERFHFGERHQTGFAVRAISEASAAMLKTVLPHLAVLLVRDLSARKVDGRLGVTIGIDFVVRLKISFSAIPP